MGERVVERKFYGSSNPSMRNDLFRLYFQEDCVEIKFPGIEDRVVLDPMASKRLGECLVDNAHVPKLLSEITHH
jgi:hypothetical protein